MPADLLKRRETHFVLWRVRNTTNPPKLIIGQFQAGNPPALAGERALPFTRSPQFADLWELPATACNLQDGQVYHYWFEVDESNLDPDRATGRARCADPFAFTVDWRLSPGDVAAAVVKYQG